MARPALAEPIAALWVLAHTMRIGVTRNLKADDPSLSTPHGHTIRSMTRAGLQLSQVDRLCGLIRRVRHVVPAIVGALSR